MIIYIQPVPKPRMTKQDKWMKRPIVLAYRAYANELKLKVKRLPEGPFKIIFHMNTKVKIRDGLAHQMRPDLDNLIKGFIDALWEEDCHIWNVHAVKLWTTKPSHIEFINL